MRKNSKKANASIMQFECKLMPEHCQNCLSKFACLLRDFDEYKYVCFHFRPYLHRKHCTEFNMPSSKQRLGHFIKAEPTEEFGMDRGGTTSLLGKRKLKDPSYGSTASRASKRARTVDESSDGETTPTSFRSNAGVKEKDRAKAFNMAFDRLRQSIPSLPKSKKLSKIEVLRLAICYMSYLEYVLHD